VTEQHTTPEQREALRARYTPEPEPTCEICESPMVYRDTYGDGSQRWDCTVNDRHPQFGSWRVIGDPDVLAACDDADALAGALAERDDAMEAQENAWRNVNLLTRRLGAERGALHEEVARLRQVLGLVLDEMEGCEGRQGMWEDGIDADYRLAIVRGRAALNPEGAPS
jgi:hypothetical protein